MVFLFKTHENEYWFDCFTNNQPIAVFEYNPIFELEVICNFHFQLDLVQLYILLRSMTSLLNSSN